MRKLITTNGMSKSEADIYKKIWNKTVATSNTSAKEQNLNNGNRFNEDEPSPLFAPANDPNDAQFFMNDYYKLSSNRRNKRTIYSRNFVNNFSSDSIYFKESDQLKQNNFTTNDKNLKETRIKSWFDDPCYHFNSSDRLTQLLKSKTGNKQSVEDRFKIYQRSNEYKHQKANNNSSIEMIENLAKKNSSLIQDFKRKYA